MTSGSFECSVSGETRRQIGKESEKQKDHSRAEFKRGESDDSEEWRPLKVSERSVITGGRQTAPFLCFSL